MIIVAGQVRVSVEDLGKDWWKEREGGLLYQTDTISLLFR